MLGNSLAVQWLGHFPFTDKGTSSVVGQGTKIMQSVWHGQNKTHTHTQLKKKIGEGGGREFWMGNTCKSMADSCQCMPKTATIL